MTFEPGQVLDLSRLQRRVHLWCTDYAARRGAAPTFADLRAADSWRIDHLQKAVERLVSKKYMRVGAHGALVALNPPHDRVVGAFCEGLGISIEEIRAPGRTPLLVTRARRLLAKKLRRDLNYTAASIGRIVNRERQTVEEYLNEEQRHRRNARRAAILRTARSAHGEARA